MKSTTTTLLLFGTVLLTAAPLFARDSKLTEGSPWTLKAWSKDGERAAVPAKGLTIAFDTKQVSGNSGVNLYSSLTIASPSGNPTEKRRRN